MTVAVGVDGGGTRTRALAVDGEGRPLGRGEGPAGIVAPGGAGRSAEAVRRAVVAALDDAGLAPPVDALWAGLAGTGREEARRAASDALEALELARSVRVGTDGEAAYRDALGEGPGVLLVAGTGSVALARSGDGARVRVGGWGALLGDEGSGYWIGLRALRAVLAAHDGRGPETSLAGVALDAFGVADAPALVGAVDGTPKARIAALAPAVVREAAAGDPAAEVVVSGAVDALLLHLRAARARTTGEDPVPLALGGGLLAPGRPLRERLASALDPDDFSLRPRRVRPERGAAALARELARR